MTTLPTAQELEMWPYQDTTSGPDLFSLEYAVRVSQALPDEETCYERGLPWHEIMAWLFDLATAYFTLYYEDDCPERDLEIMGALDTMQFDPGPLFYGLETLTSAPESGVWDDALAAYEYLLTTINPE